MRKVAAAGVTPKIFNGAVYAGATMEQVPYLRVTRKAAPGLCGGATRGYDVHGGEDAASPLRRLFVAEEDSKLCSRLCCRPFHSRSVYVKHAHSKEVLVTVERPGAECCCDRCSAGAKPLLCLPTWAEACGDGVVVHEGKADGVPGFMPLDRVVGVVHQPASCGCVPHFEVLDENYDVLGYVEGRPCFGGAWDACLDASFTYSKAPGRQGDKGHVAHVAKKPCGGAPSHVDLDFAVVPGKDKLMALASTIMLDAAYFERDNSVLVCHRRHGTCQSTCCLCYAFGCYCPLAVTLPPGAGAPPAPDAKGDDDDARGPVPPLAMER